MCYTDFLAFPFTFDLSYIFCILYILSIIFLSFQSCVLFLTFTVTAVAASHFILFVFVNSVFVMLHVGLCQWMLNHLWGNICCCCSLIFPHFLDLPILPSVCELWFFLYFPLKHFAVPDLLQCSCKQKNNYGVRSIFECVCYFCVLLVMRIFHV